jgi:hypothetical protein
MGLRAVSNRDQVFVEQRPQKSAPWARIPCTASPIIQTTLMRLCQRKKMLRRRKAHRLSKMKTVALNSGKS